MDGRPMNVPVMAHLPVAHAMNSAMQAVMVAKMANMPNTVSQASKLIVEAVVDEAERCMPHEFEVVIRLVEDIQLHGDSAAKALLADTPALQYVLDSSVSRDRVETCRYQLAFQLLETLG